MKNSRAALSQYKKQLLLCVLAGLLTCYSSAYWFQLMMIQGESMYPSYHSYQIVLLDKREREWKAGDVIAFRCENLHALLVKRIVAVPHDTVEIVDGALYVNRRVNMEALRKGYIEEAGFARKRVTLAEDEYFVLGDNYKYSKDSRHKEVGFVKRSSIAGRVLPSLDKAEDQDG